MVVTKAVGIYVKLVSATTVNEPELPATVTDKAPLQFLFMGTETDNCVAVADITAAGIPLSVTASLLAVALNPVPVMVTRALWLAAVGLKPAILSATGLGLVPPPELLLGAGLFFLQPAIIKT